MEQWVLLFVLCIGASFVLRVVGFGFGIFIMTWLTTLMPSYGEATALSGILAMCTSAWVVFRMRKHLVWSHLWPMLLTFVAVSAFSICCLSRIEDRVLNMVLGIVLILVSLYFLFLNGRIHIRPTRTAQIGAGTLSGLMGGFFAMQGPPAVLYFLESERDKDRYMALIQTYLFTGNIGMTAVRAANGFVTPAVGWGIVYGIGGVVIGSLIGTLVYRHISTKVLRTLVYLFLGVSGVLLLCR